MFEDLGRTLEENQRKRDAQMARNAAEANPAIAGQNMDFDSTGKYADKDVYQEGGGARGVPTARFPDAQVPTARFPDANPPGVEQVPPMTIAGGPRPPMTPDQQALAGQLDAMGNQVTAGIQGGGAPAAPAAPGVSPGQLDALAAQATQGMGTPANLPTIRPVDTAGLDAYARMQRGGM